MPSIHDVVSYLCELEREHPKARGYSSMQLNKLAFMANAHYHRELQRNLFPEDFEVSEMGPRYRALMAIHGGVFNIQSWPLGSSEALHPAEREYLRRIWERMSFLSGPMLASICKKMQEYTDRQRQELATALAKSEVS